MSITCKDLFAGVDCTIIGNESEELTGVAFSNNRVLPGDAFFCIVGTKVDGHSFAQDAIDRGARVIVVERKVYLADASDITEVVVSDSRKALSIAASNFYNRPSEGLNLVGITGTNGKTTTTYLVEHIAASAGNTTGVIGTVGIKVGADIQPATHTTPESSDLQAIFSRMKEAECDVVAMEVSSHALDLERTWGTKFEVTAFTNLTQDHLDYHNTFESYFEAKARLFSKQYPAKRVINIDDEWGKKLLARCSQAEDEILTVGFDRSALIHPVDVEYFTDKTKVTLDVRGSRYTFTYPLVGKFNVSNVMLAFGIAFELGIPAVAIVSALESAPQVPGRLQRISAEHDGGISVFVDYAHTPDALEKAIASVKNLSSARTIVVFGCGGDRDATKRPIMGKAALAADFAVVTSDNPRTEDPDAIIEGIVAGMASEDDRFCVEADRRLAIAKAISIANPGDSILVAGKGHEDYQILGTEKIHFLDAEVIAEELEKAFG